MMNSLGPEGGRALTGTLSLTRVPTTHFHAPDIIKLPLAPRLEPPAGTNIAISRRKVQFHLLLAA